VSALVGERTSLLRLPDEVEAREARAAFLAAQPFAHAVWSDTVAAAPADVDAAFPAPDWVGWHRYGDEYQRGKRICTDLDRMPPLLQRMVHELHAPATLRMLEALTGIEGLVPDPYLEGGGLHASVGGGALTPHTDFHIYPRLGLYRRLNLIVYLSGDWPDGDRGGSLGLYAAGEQEPAVVVPPTFGTCVVFRTDDRSRHGFTAPVPDGCYRRSLALYYYTATEAPDFSGDTNTYWDNRDAGRGMTGIRHRAYRALLFGSRALSWLAHRANPRLHPTEETS
jgi:hypothetical protein